MFGIRYPVVSGGMVWCSGWRLASAVSNCGGLGLLGAGSMHPDTLREHIRRMKEATDKPWGVNVPLLYPEMEALMGILVEEGVKVVFTSAGSPKKWTSFLKGHGMKVAHVVSSAAFALKCEEAGCDAVVAEGFEAGGHNGREETTTMALIPNVAARRGASLRAGRCWRRWCSGRTACRSARALPPRGNPRRTRRSNGRYGRRRKGGRCWC